jgi:1-acyl-sn-glycerol-3-phosphate acyltransferase
MTTERPLAAAAEMDVYLDRPAWRIAALQGVTRIVVRCLFRLRVEGMEHYPKGPAVVCFNHLNWFDPFVIAAAIPSRPPFSAFGPKEADMSVGWRNRFMSWLGVPVPYRPEKDDLRLATRRVDRVLARGRVLFIAGEGRIHVGERRLLPLSDGPAYFALRAGVPLVPLAVNGTGWLGFGRTVRVRVGPPIPVAGRPTREAVEGLTGQLSAALLSLVADFPDRRPPGPAWQRLTELFNDWPEGSRPPLEPGGRGGAAAEPE